LLLAEDEHDQIRVLFESAGFAQIGKLRAVIGSGFRRARELREGDQGHVQLLGESFE
jgi:hypothetical protein